MTRDACPNCGRPLASTDLEGTCPACLPRTDLDGSRTLDPDASTAPGVLETLAATTGPMPRVLLRDTDGAPEPPPNRPASTADAAAPRYRIDGEIARGGMGAVLRGRDPDLNREVALKVLRDDLRDRPEFVARFVEEAQIGGQLQHPGVVPIYELGTLADRRPFFAMKLVKGRTLAALLDARKSPADGLPRLLGIFEQVAQAVAYAHARGVIHRDLKPSNVMVGSFGEVQVMDWGLAKVLRRGGEADDRTAGRLPEETVIATARSGGDSDLELSRAGSIMGTPSYMAPEQARGDLDAIDERADVFALGSILCQLLTGQPAFTGRSSTEILFKAAQAQTADALARLEACGADAELVALARDCLAAEPAGRPRDGAAVTDRITVHLAGVQERLRLAEINRARAEAVAAEERRRRKLQVGLAASLLALTTLGGLALSFELQRRQALAARADRLLAEVAPLLDQARAQPEDVARWERADEALDRIADDLGPTPPDRLSDLRREVETGLAAAVADRDLLAQLVDTRSAQADDPDRSATDEAYADHLSEAGLDPIRDDPDEVGARIARRPAPVAAALVAALDHWAAVRRDRDPNGTGWARILAAARVADPDPDRDALRDALLVTDRAERLDRLRPLAERADVGSWAPASLVLLGDSLADAGDANAGVAVLRRASWSHPEDARVHYVLAQTLERTQPPQREEAIRALSIAWGRQPKLAAHDLAHHLQQLGRDEDAETVWSDLIARRPDNGHDLGCYGAHLKERGRDAEADPVLARAVVALRQAIRQRPNDANPRNQLGLALKQLGDLDGAITAHRDAIRLRPRYAGAHLSLGIALEDSGDRDGAIDAYREAIRIRPDYAIAHYNLGVALRARGDLDGAIDALRNAVRSRPDAPEAYNNLGNALRARGDLDGAIVAFQGAIRSRPDLPETHNNLGNVLDDRGDVDGAIDAFREAIRLRPDYAIAHYNLGNVLRISGDFDEAIIAYREAIRIQPEFPEAHCNLGLALKRAGDVEGAIKAYQEAIRLQPEIPEAHSNLGIALHSSGDLKGAIVAFREAIRLKPDYPTALYSLGNVLRIKGDLDGAIQAYREVVRLQPRFAEAHCNLGLVLDRAGDHDGAIEAYHEAIGLKPDIPEAHYNLGLALDGPGELDRAIEAFREAVRLRPDYARAHSSLANALRNSGDLDGAIVAYREAIRLQPDDARAHYNLGETLSEQGRYAEALAEYRLGHELGSKLPGWRFPSAARVARAEQLAALADRLPAILAGTDEPADEDERLALARVAYDTKRYAAASRFWEEAFDADPELADDRRAQPAYNAACAAALAAVGKGEDDPPPDDESRAELRRKALGWLRSELAAWATVLDSGDPKARAAVAPTLRHWKVDADLAGVRDEAALASLPEPERADWQALWKDVDATLAKAEAP